ncbi:hypothetical protein BV898_08405 [Hypsibius exemplaris]|uniref:C2HC/C3H-type domain-containing protein n=1 Tax=Hypsibius exemplaris TaxID=2072580 RepID=A0A1W0WQI9_HYPEX|nr:hypothetical protein BV898_08405 [Hypsibius exemplaris]
MLHSMMRGKRDENPQHSMAPQLHSPVVDFDEVAIRPAPQKPFETAESPNRDLLALSPCDYCGRKFNATNLSRHVTICERLAHKPKREAFATVAQRLSHVAQEDSVKPVIRQMMERRPPADEENNNRPTDHLPKALRKMGAPVRKKSPVRGGGRTGADLFREQQKGHSKCEFCERTFREEAYVRHVDFCKTQYLSKQRQRGKEDPRSDLLKRRVQYRPPLPRTNSKESPILPRKAVSAFSSEQKPARPADLKILGSQSAMARVNPRPAAAAAAKTPTGLDKLTGKLSSMVLSDYSGAGGAAAGVNGQQRRARIITPCQQQEQRTSPSDYGSGESLLFRTGSVRAKPNNGGPSTTAATSNGISRQVVMGNSHKVHHNGGGGGAAPLLPEYDGGSGDGSSVESLLSRTGSLRVKGVFNASPGGGGCGNVLPSKSVAVDNVHKIYHSGDLLSRTGSVRSGKKATSDGGGTSMPTTPASGLSKTLGYSSGGRLELEEAIRSNGGKIRLHTTPEHSGGQKSMAEVARTIMNPADRPYPFNVASAQKEEMMLIHRSNSVRAKNSSVDSSSVDWDSFLKPAVLRTPGGADKDEHRLFQWEGDQYRAPRQRNPVKLADFSRDESRINASSGMSRSKGYYDESSAGDQRNRAQQVISASSLSESLEETEDNSSDSVSPVSASLMGSTSSVKSSSAIGSSLSSVYGLQQPKPQSKAASSPSPPRFCHNCGNAFPIENASFCCHCGMARLVTRIPIY